MPPTHIQRSRRGVEVGDAHWSEYFTRDMREEIEMHSVDLD